MGCQHVSGSMLHIKNSKGPHLCLRVSINSRDNRSATLLPCNERACLQFYFKFLFYVLLKITRIVSRITRGRRKEPQKPNWESKDGAPQPCPPSSPSQAEFMACPSKGRPILKEAPSTTSNTGPSGALHPPRGMLLLPN